MKAGAHRPDHSHERKVAAAMQPTRSHVPTCRLSGPVPSSTARGPSMSITSTNAVACTT